MRTIFLIVVLLSVAAAKAQTVIPLGLTGYAPGARFENNMFTADSLSKKKWSFNRFGGISTSFTFFKGGNATIVSAPVGLQLNRRLTNNLYAFANVAVAPSYVNFNHSFLTRGPDKYNSGSIFSGTGRMGVYTAASMGVMYINDNRTFSISGSISVEKSSMPLLYPANTLRTIPVNPATR